MLLTLVVRYSSVPVTPTGRGDGGGRPVGRRRPDVTFADRTVVCRLGAGRKRGARCHAEGARYQATEPGAHHQAGARHRREDGGGGDGGGYLTRLVTPIAALTQLLRTAGAVGYLGRPGRLMENSELVAKPGKLLWHCNDPWLCLQRMTPRAAARCAAGPPGAFGACGRRCGRAGQRQCCAGHLPTERPI